MYIRFSECLKKKIEEKDKEVISARQETLDMEKKVLAMENILDMVENGKSSDVSDIEGSPSMDTV